MDAHVEDRIVVESERAAQSGRAGVIEEVLAQDPPRFRVRWDDGRTSIFAPSTGVTRIEHLEDAFAAADLTFPIKYNEPVTSTAPFLPAICEASVNASVQFGRTAPSFPVHCFHWLASSFGSESYTTI